MKRFGVLSACFGFWPILLVAQSSDLTQNLADCNNGMTSCDHSRLSQSEAGESSLAQHRRNLENCQDGFGDCDRSKLTQTELGTVDLSLRERNVSNCKDGAGV